MSSDLAHGAEAEGNGVEAPPAGRPHAVFISDFLHLGRPFQRLAALLLDDRGAWMHAAERSAEAQGFVLTAGSPRQYESAVIIPMHWQPTATEPLVPALDADIELSTLGSDHCRLSLSGRYRVPADERSDSAGRLAAHREAETAIRSFLFEVAKALEA